MDDIVVHAVLFAPGVEQLHCANGLLLNGMHARNFHSLRHGGLASVQRSRIDLGMRHYEFDRIYQANKDVKLILYRKKKT